jgi:hypothetical protein
MLRVVNNEIAQCIALATWGTIGLRDGAPAARGLGLANDAFRFTRRLEFEGIGVADEWLASLAALGVERIWLAVDPTLVTPAAVDARTWRGEFAFVNAMNARVGLLAGTELWRGMTDAPPGPNDRPWETVYKPVRAPMRPMTPPLGDAIDRLERALDQAIGFAHRHAELSHFNAVFTNAMELGRADGPDLPSHNLFPDSGYTTGARRLAAMAQAAWVFGAMGSWNDMGFQEPEVEREFQDVTSALFSAILFAVIAAVNSKLTRVGHASAN